MTCPHHREIDTDHYASVAHPGESFICGCCKNSYRSLSGDKGLCRHCKSKRYTKERRISK